MLYLRYLTIILALLVAAGAFADDGIFTTAEGDTAEIFSRMLAVRQSDAYGQLEDHRKRMVDDVIQAFEHNGVNLDAERLEQFRTLKAEITDLSSRYSINMNTANEVLVLDEKGAEGLPENFLEGYRGEDGSYRIPVMPATRRPVLNNASHPETRKAYLVKYQNRG